MLAIMGFLILQDKNRISGQHGGSSNQPQQAALEIPISLEFLPLPARLMISTLLLKRRGKALQCSVWHSAARRPFVQISVVQLPISVQF